MLTQGFKDTYKSLKSDPKWGVHDTVIAATIDLYAEFLNYGLNPINVLIVEKGGGFHRDSAKFSFTPPTFNLIKAMVLIESGGITYPSWAGKAMRIGVFKKDTGIQALRNGRDGKLVNSEGSELVVPKSVLDKLTDGDISTPKYNIQAGVGYFITKAAGKTFGDVFSYDQHGPLVSSPFSIRQTVAVKSGDTLEKIAKRNHTTEHVLRWVNGKYANNLKEGRALAYYEATFRRYITGFAEFNSQSAADLYNTGDADYKDKLDYIIDFLSKP